MSKAQTIVMMRQVLNLTALQLIHLLYEQNITIKIETWDHGDYELKTHRNQGFRISDEFPVHVHPNKLGDKGSNFLTIEFTDCSISMTDGTTIDVDKRSKKITITDIRPTDKQKTVRVLKY